MLTSSMSLHKMLSIVSGWGWVGSRQQWLLSLSCVKLCEHILIAFYAFLDSPIRSSHHGRTKTMLNLVVFQEVLKLFTCEHAGTVRLKDSAEAKVEHPLKDMVY